MRKRGLLALHKLAKSDRDVLYIGSDVGPGTMADFKKECPDQFFMEGIAESYIIGMAAGLAMCGKVPYVNTIATFLTRRCYEQLAVDVCMGNHKVRLIASGGGLVYAPLGPTHLATNDIALMRSLPNMTIVVPCDADEMEKAVMASKDYPGPIYIRVARGGEPPVDQKGQFAIGKANVLKPGKDLVIIATGVMVHRALEAQAKLAEQGIQAGVVNVHTVKPLDHKTLRQVISETPHVLTVEEHVLSGGLGEAIASFLSDAKLTQKACFKMMGISDCFPDKYGSQFDLLKYYQLDVESIVREAKQLLSKPTGVIK
jgi:transketolase